MKTHQQNFFELLSRLTKELLDTQEHFREVYGKQLEAEKDGAYWRGRATQLSTMLENPPPAMAERPPAVVMDLVRTVGDQLTRKIADLTEQLDRSQKKKTEARDAWAASERDRAEEMVRHGGAQTLIADVRATKEAVLALRNAIGEVNAIPGNAEEFEGEEMVEVFADAFERSIGEPVAKALDTLDVVEKAVSALMAESDTLLRAVSAVEQQLERQNTARPHDLDALAVRLRKEVAEELRSTIESLPKRMQTIEEQNAEVLQLLSDFDNCDCASRREEVEPLVGLPYPIDGQRMALRVGDQTHVIENAEVRISPPDEPVKLAPWIHEIESISKKVDALGKTFAELIDQSPKAWEFHEVREDVGAIRLQMKATNAQLQKITEMLQNPAQVVMTNEAAAGSMRPVYVPQGANREEKLRDLEVRLRWLMSENLLTSKQIVDTWGVIEKLRMEGDVKPPAHSTATRRVVEDMIRRVNEPPPAPVLRPLPRCPKCDSSSFTTTGHCATCGEFVAESLTYGKE